jgi:type IV pilus assembly protein PilA
MKIRQNKTGFTLIELIIIMMIIGILAAIIQPTYCDYADKAKVSAGLMSLSVIQIDIEHYFITHNQWPQNNKDIFFDPFKLINNHYIASINIIKEGNILIKFNDNIQNLANKTIVLSPKLEKNLTTLNKKQTIKFIWDCRGGTLRNNERPVSCR